jgi:hypothetical protein
MTTTEQEPYLEELKVRFSLDAFVRRAIANKLHHAWLDEHLAEQDARISRLEAIMPGRDYEMARRRLLTAKQLVAVRDLVKRVPDTVRLDLDRQQYKLATEVYIHLGAEPRRRVCEVRCWLIDAIERLDELNFDQALHLVVEAERSLSFMLTSHPQNDRPSRNRMEFDHLLRERTQRVVSALRADAAALGEVRA